MWSLINLWTASKFSWKATLREREHGTHGKLTAVKHDSSGYLGAATLVRLAATTPKHQP